MRNIIQQQDDLKNLSQQQLIAAMQSGTYPQFLVLSELNRRKRMNDDQARREAVDDTNTVAQEVVSAAGVPQGGIAQLASAMNAKTDNTQNTGVMQMAEGGVVKMKTAGSVRTDKEYIAELKRLYPEVYELYKNNYNEKDLADLARAYLEGSVSTPDKTGLEALEAPRRFDLLKRLTTDPSSITANKMRQKVKDSIEERELQARQETLQRLRDRDKFYIGADPIFNDGGFSEQLKGTVVPVPLAEDPLKFRPPNNMSGPSVATDSPLNMANVSQPELGPMFPLVSSNRPTAEPTNLPVNTSPAFTSMLPNIAQGTVNLGGDARDAAIKDYLATEDGLVDLQDQINETGASRFGGDRNTTSLMLEELLKLRDDPETPYFKSPRDRAVIDVNKRAMDFIKSDTYTPPSEIYSDYLGGDARAIARYQEESPETIQAISDRLATEAAADEAAKTQASLTDLTENNKEGLGPDAAAAVREGALRRLQDQMQPTLVEGVNIPEQDQSLFVDAGELALKGLGKSYEIGTKVGDYVKDRGALIANQINKDFLTPALEADKIVRGKISDYLFGEDVPKEGEGSLTAAESTASKANEAAVAKVDPTQAAINKIIENQNKQAEASNLTMAKYLEGLEKDREFAKAMALVEAGGQLMQPSATIGEGAGKAAQKFAKSSKEGQKEYNRSKLAILTLGAKIDAAKASASARAGIAGARLQTATLADERDQLQSQLDMVMLPFMGGKPPDAKSSIKIKELQRKIADLNNQIRTASGLATLASVGADSGNIFGSYDVTKTG